MIKEKSVLFCDPDIDWLQKSIPSLESSTINSEVATNGKNAQMLLYKKQYNTVIIDLALKDYSSFEVIKYIKLNKHKAKIILTATNQKILDDYGLSTSAARKLGISEILVKPYAVKYLIELIHSTQLNQAWRNIKQNDNAAIEEEVTVRDDAFTSIKIDEFFCGNVAIFDLFIRLDKNKFLKILNAGDFLEQTRVDNYKKNKKVDLLYFKTKDRSAYVNFLNSVVAKALNDKSISDVTKLNLTKNLTEKFIEEVYVSGFSEHTFEEGKAVSENIFNMIEKSKDLSRLLKEQCSYDDNAMTHLFLTALYSSIICNKLGWASKNTQESVAMGAFFHDIGKIKLPKSIREKKPWELTPEQYEEYKNHSQYGVDLLYSVPQINERVRQIIFQHHELVDGKGFPNELFGTKIFPLSQIVGFSNILANKVVLKSTPPLTVVKEMIKQQTEIYQYSPDVVRAFIAGLLKNG